MPKRYDAGEVITAMVTPFNKNKEVDYEKGRLKVSVSIFGRATPVELEFGQVEKTR